MIIYFLFRELNEKIDTTQRVSTSNLLLQLQVPSTQMSNYSFKDIITGFKNVRWTFSTICWHFTNADNENNRFMQQQGYIFLLLCRLFAKRYTHLLYASNNETLHYENSACRHLFMCALVNSFCGFSKSSPQAEILSSLSSMAVISGFVSAWRRCAVQICYRTFVLSSKTSQHSAAEVVWAQFPSSDRLFNVLSTSLI